MKIVVLQGSPNSKGSTNILVENFIKGSREKGHVVTRFDVSKMNIKPCLGCVTCGYEGPCVQKDDNEVIKKALLSSDMLVLATPPFIIRKCLLN
ncbi:flavodoxin family protein [Faecalibacillus intestinalis]|uniref:flavodoxin family protein n=1 Tax=Faecalibacillus intestinalis TaxID=1982626 RepID=UPI00210DCCB0|nr:NAD(P)H-dependent oxidoreductase [Faecalibacillus intestinalis]MCQ4768541.1 flavodoxin family protein [Faecalibacillus intestinalis]